MAKISLQVKLGDLGVKLEELTDSIADDLSKAGEQIARMVQNEAIRLAHMKLKTGANMYADNIKMEELGDNQWVIYIADDSPALHLEEGFPPFDMKPGFLNSAKAKTTKDGKNKYFDVPFKIEPNADSPAGKSITDMRSAVASVLQDKSVSKRIQEFNSGGSGLERFGEVTRYNLPKDSKVHGLVQVKPPNEDTKTYLFRRVSKNSDDTKFQHPGFGGAKIFNELEAYANREVDTILLKILGAGIK